MLYELSEIVFCCSLQRIICEKILQGVPHRLGPLVLNLYSSIFGDTHYHK